MHTPDSLLLKPRWFALTVKPQHERTVETALHHHGLETFVPLYKSRRTWSDRIKHLELALFPGYVFCRFPFARRLPVLNTPGVVSVVGFGSKPAPMEDGEIEQLKKAVCSGAPLQPWPFLEAGQRVRVERGPLCGLEGVLMESKGACRVVLSLWLLQRSVAVEIDRNLVSPCNVRRVFAIAG